MSGIELTNFSRGMITDVSELYQIEGAVSQMKNCNVWDKLGKVILNNIINYLEDFVSGERYYKHYLFKRADNKVVVLFLTQSGKLYEFDLNLNTYSLLYTSTTTADNIALIIAGTSVYIIENKTTNQKYVLEYDTDSSSWKQYTGFAQPVVTSGATSLLSSGYTTNKAIKAVLTRIGGDGASESQGVVFYFNHNLSYVGFGVSYNDYYLSITESGSGNVSKGYRLYMSVSEYDSAKSRYNDFLEPQSVYVINKVGEKSFVPVYEGRIRNTGSKIRVDKISAGTDISNYFTKLCDEYIAGNLYIDVGHKIKINESYSGTIVSISYNSADPANTYYEIVMSSAVPTFDTEHQDSGSNFNNIEIEIQWYNNQIIIPVQRRYENILGMPLSEIRPDTKLLSPSTNLVSFSQNRLFYANPYWIYYDPLAGWEKNEEEKIGYVSWSYITGEGLYADFIAPNTQLVGTPTGHINIVDLADYRSNLIIFSKEGISTIKLQNDIPYIYDIYNEGIENNYNYLIENDRMFIYSKGTVKMAYLDRTFSANSQLRFIDIGKPIKSLFNNRDVRFAYDKFNDILYVQTLSGSKEIYICTIREDNYIWQEYEPNFNIKSGFNIGKDFYIIATDSGDTSDYIYKLDYSQYLNTDIVLKSRPIYFPLMENFIRKIEALYSFSSGVVLLELYLDDSLVSTYTLTAQTSLDFFEIHLPRNKKTRAEKMYFRLTANSVSNDFQFLGLFINRDQYTQQILKGY
jgi:hypothetical protein